MTENVYLTIAQEKGLIDQDDYQGWRLTGKGERFWSLLIDRNRRREYEIAVDLLSERLPNWTFTDWYDACFNDHPTRIQVRAASSPAASYWIGVIQATDVRYDIARIIAGQHETLVREQWYTDDN